MQETIINLSAIFNRGNALTKETDAFFKGMKHDTLIEKFTAFLGGATAYIGNPKLTSTQALNDHGVDILVEFPDGTKVGIQVKSPFDVAEEQFAVKVKAQMTDSLIHGLDKWYLFICSPLSYVLKGEDKSREPRISHLVNELSGYKTQYHAVYVPQQVCAIFSKPQLTSEEFDAIKSQFSVGPVDKPKLTKQIMTDPNVSHFLYKDKESSHFNVPKKAALYNEYLLITEEDEMQAAVDQLQDLQNLLKKLPQKSREFLFECLNRIRKKGIGDSFLANAEEVRSFLGIEVEELRKQVSVLKGLRIAEFEEPDDDGTFYIGVQKTNSDYNILNDVKLFCDIKNKPLREIIVNLDFSHFN